MEKWIASNIGSIVSILSIVGGLLVLFGKLRAKIDELDQKLSQLTEDFEKLRDAGMPMLCRIHEDRLLRIEQTIQQNVVNVNAQITEIKALVAANHDLLIQTHFKSQE